MPRRIRLCPQGEVFHVLNRAVARLTIFEKPEDYDSFLQVFDQTWKLVPLPIFALVLTPNHWHFVVRPNHDKQVSEFFQRLSVMHTMRYHSHYKTGGTGHLYQGRFKSFPIQADEHLWMAMRYVERNPIRANFVERAEDWAWSSARMRHRPTENRSWLTTAVDSPPPSEWSSWVNRAEPQSELISLRHCNRPGLPFSYNAWIMHSTVGVRLESRSRPCRRPRKEATLFLRPPHKLRVTHDLSVEKV
jgi:putative transposase